MNLLRSIVFSFDVNTGLKKGVGGRRFDPAASAARPMVYRRWSVGIGVLQELTLVGKVFYY